MTTHHFKPLWLLAATSALAVATPAAVAQPSVASNCTGISISPTNVAVNRGFELPAAHVPMGSLTCWQNGHLVPSNSAAAGWQVHSSNSGATVCSRPVEGTAPGPDGRRKVAFPAGSNVGGPLSFRTKLGEWEQPRVGTNSRAVTDILSIYCQDPAGGSFFVDRVELREIPIVE